MDELKNYKQYGQIKRALLTFFFLFSSPRVNTANTSCTHQLDSVNPSHLLPHSVLNIFKGTFTLNHLDTWHKNDCRARITDVKSSSEGVRSV